uniref:Ubiquitin-like protease family profile domain-containing protein n=2 Tax=Aegilops tauschii subsp. strangulata TaxID=200361 RepID=A0A452Y627_AEGTS
HWSLVIMCVPAKKSNSGPILLHLDSLGMHPTLEELMTAVVIFQIQQCILGTGNKKGIT